MKESNLGKKQGINENRPKKKKKKAQQRDQENRIEGEGHEQQPQWRQKKGGFQNRSFVFEFPTYIPFYMYCVRFR